ncbi:MAG: hypothetical protein HY552_07275 [Elusimicrobia bacterium]|nr:hypothetical protein [Elusimicrobiota bacterium]
MTALALALLLAPGAGALARLDGAQSLAIGRRIWQNECGGKVDELTHWNQGEDFASLGIGHFIWYPAGRRGPFTESFPGALDAVAASGRPLPAWLKGRPPCPWNSREEFFADFRSPRMNELRALLADTVAVQARYAAGRLEAALPQLLAAAPRRKRKALRRRFEAVAAAPNGVYALMDYVNFKGEGISPTERYDGLGWGLLQALELMEDAPPGQPAVEAFARAADAALTRRTEHAPPERRERERGWLPGWRARLKTYLEP